MTLVKRVRPGPLSTIAKLTKGETVTTDVLERICHVLGYDIEDIMELKANRLYCCQV